MDIRVLSFTGSSRTGRLIQEAAAKSNLKNVLLELGGNSPAIIFPDCNIDKAVRQTKFSIQFNSGQTCMGNSRIYVHEAIADTFLEKFHKAFVVESGDPLLPGTNHGPQADVLQYNQVQKYIEEGKKVAKMTLGEVPIGHKNGFFVQPTVFVNTPEDAKIMKEEIFGPVVSVMRCSSLDDAIAIGNDVAYGLSASIYTRDINKAFQAMRDMYTGIFYVNAPTIGAEVHLPFGGTKATGNGHREAGLAALDVFSEWKSVYVDFSGKLQRAQIDG